MPGCDVNDLVDKDSTNFELPIALESRGLRKFNNKLPTHRSRKLIGGADFTMCFSQRFPAMSAS